MSWGSSRKTQKYFWPVEASSMLRLSTKVFCLHLYEASLWQSCSCLSCEKFLFASRGATVEPPTASFDLMRKAVPRHLIYWSRGVGKWSFSRWQRTSPLSFFFRKWAKGCKPTASEQVGVVLVAACLLFCWAGVFGAVSDFFVCYLSQSIARADMANPLYCFLYYNFGSDSIYRKNVILFGC